MSHKYTKNPFFLTAIIVLSAFIFVALGTVVETYFNPTALAGINLSADQKLANVESELFLEVGYESKIALNDAVLKMVEGGVIDPDKFSNLYAARGGLSAGLADVLTKSSVDPIVLTKENAGVYLNLLWPLGLSNTMAANENSPINGENLHNFAATGGWTLAKEGRGGDYFNKIAAVSLTPEQETMVVSIAENVFRPCCNNSTYFQDCNHGSALLGLLQLGAAQGLSENDLYNEALAFNTYWFPSNYTQTALYFETVQDLAWDEVDPKVILSSLYSSGSGWGQNVAQPLAQLQGAAGKGAGPSCGV